MDIRKARIDEIDALQAIYDTGRSHMRANGNAAQWVNGYPSDSLLENDIANGNLYVMDDGDGIHAVFAFVPGNDPTYDVIENGEWLNDEPYGAIHRVASDGTVRGVMHRVVEFCKQSGLDLRIDTHESNAPMRGACVKEGFVECGIITIEDGTKRVAYHLPSPSS